MKLGEANHEKEVLESRKQTVHPHSTSNINIPEEHLSKIHTENAVLLHNCLFLRSTKTLQNFNSRWDLITVQSLYVSYSLQKGSTLKKTEFVWKLGMVTALGQDTD